MREARIVSQSRSSEYKMAYGSAFHTFAEKYYGSDQLTNECIDAAMTQYEPHAFNVPASDNVRTMGALEATCVTYAKHHRRDEFKPIELDGKPAVEVKFIWPLRQHPLFELVTSGTLDMIARDQHGIECIVDHKTTSSRQPDAFINGYYKDIQAMLYVVMERRITKRNHYLPFIVNGVFLRKGGADFKRGVVQFIDDELIAFERWFERRVDEIYNMLVDYVTMGGLAREERSQCKQFFGTCKFWDLCRVGSDSDLARSLSETKYERVPYNPTEWH